MAYKIEVSPIASQNIEEAISYYLNHVSKKVAADFLKDYKNTYKSLQKNPFYQYHDNNYRFLPFKKFPFIVFFMVDETNQIVYIKAVFNTHQNPKKSI